MPRLGSFGAKLTVFIIAGYGSILCFLTPCMGHLTRGKMPARVGDHVGPSKATESKGHCKSWFNNHGGEIVRCE